MARRGGAAALACGLAIAAQAAPCQPIALPPPSSEPFAIDFAADPLLAYGRSADPPARFAEAARAALVRQPLVQRRIATQDEQAARLVEARSAWLPSADVAIIGDRTLSRNFGGNQGNFLERFRPRGRTDATVAIDQLIFDFGAADHRIVAERLRLAAAGEDLRAEADLVALRLASAWSTIAGAARLVALADAQVGEVDRLRGFVDDRIRQGASAQGDAVRVDASLAASRTRRIVAERTLAEARARSLEITGTPAPAELARPGFPGLAVGDAGTARSDAVQRTAGARHRGAPYR